MTETADVKDGTGEGAVTVPEPASGAILRAISDPGSILPRLEGESVSFWQLRAVLERAAPLIAAEALSSLAAEFERCADTLGTIAGNPHTISTWEQAAEMARREALRHQGAAEAPGTGTGEDGGVLERPSPAQSHEYLRTSMTTRQGRKVPRMLYRQLGNEPADDDPIIGLVDTPELAALIVAAVNAWHAREATDG